MAHYIYGIHACEELINLNPERIQKIFISRQNKRVQKIAEKAKNFNVILVSNSELAHYVDGNHQGIVIQVSQRKQYSENDLQSIIDNAQENSLYLILDGVQDPHNLGACLRTADGAGVACVIIPKDRAVGITSTVEKIACGAAETIPVIAVTNLARTIESLKQQGIWIYGLAGEANTSLYDAKFTGPTAMVLGAEEKGLRRLTRETCDELLSIPLAGQVSSLNVSVATGIALFEVVRQRTAATLA